MVYIYPILLNLPLLPLKCSWYYLLFPSHFFSALVLKQMEPNLAGNTKISLFLGFPWVQINHNVIILRRPK